MRTWPRALHNGVVTKEEMASFFDVDNTTVIISETTTPDFWWKLEVSDTTYYLTLLLVIVVMLAMGCTVSIQDLYNVLRCPWPVLVGLLSQFVLLPPVAFGLTAILAVRPIHAISVVIMASCPGGSFSNIFTYWSDGNVPVRYLLITYLFQFNWLVIF